MRVGNDLPESCSKNGDVPKSPLAPLSSHSAIGGHNFNSKIDLGLSARARLLLRAPQRDSKTARRKTTMNRRATLAMTTTGLLCLAVGLSASDALAQQKSLKEQLVGTWTLVSSDQVRPDGTKVQQFGSDPKGINVFDANGRFFIMIASADNLQIASNGRSQKNFEKDDLIVESIAYYGTYTVNEDVKVISLHLDASTFPNQDGTEQKRTITALTADELKYSSPAAISGAQIHQVWKRAK
jgi:Lipocalin-like domain